MLNTSLCKLNINLKKSLWLFIFKIFLIEFYEMNYFLFYRSKFISFVFRKANKKILFLSLNVGELNFNLRYETFLVLNWDKVKKENWY